MNYFISDSVLPGTGIETVALDAAGENPGTSAIVLIASAVPSQIFRFYLTESLQV